MDNKRENHSLVSDYIKMRLIYEEFTQKYKALITNLIKDSGIPVHSITSRTKEIDSFRRKMSKRVGKYRKLSDMTDLSGIRICCYLESQIKEVTKLIKKNFTVFPKLSVDKKEIIDSDRFGYLSSHYVVKLAGNRAKLPEYKKYKDLLVEIQIRTILQHAWAAIEHDLGYKSNTEIPKNIRRKFSRLAGLLELADEQFDEIKKQIEHYSSKVAKKIITKPKEVAIDNISMKTYILNSPLIKELDEEIVKIGRGRLSNEIITEFNVKICNYFNIKSIQELECIVKKEKYNLIKFAKAFLGKEGFKARIINKGISLFFLGYLLIPLTENIEPIKDYLISMEIGRTHSEKDTLATALSIKKIIYQIKKGK